MSFEVFRLNRSRHLTHAVTIEKDANSAAVASYTELHDRLMRPLIDLTQLDIGSLDGSPESLRMRDRVNQLLESFGADEV